MELLLLIGASVVMGKIANADNSSGIIWGSVCFVLCLGSLVIPLPFLPIGIACAATVGAMIAVKMLRK
jgi:hypothetical protein